MIYIEYLFKIVLFLSIVWLSYKVSKKTFKKKSRLTWIGLIVLTTLFSLYSVIVTSPNLAGDRGNYFFRYREGWDISHSSLGLNWLYDVLRPISLDANFLWFSTSFIFISITLIGYKYYKQAVPLVLLALLSSNYVVYGYALLKQSMANAFACIVFMLYFNLRRSDSTIKKIVTYIAIFIFVVLATLFHEAAFMLIPIIIILSLWKYGFFKGFGWLALLVVFIGFPIISGWFFENIGMLSESLEEQTIDYANNEVGHEGGILTLIKGVPFYLITIVAIFKRKQFQMIIEKYDSYLLLSIILSITSFLTLYNYWYARLGMLLYLPVFVFSSMLYNKMSKRNDLKTLLRIAYVVLLLLTTRLLSLYYFLYGGL